jgi:hypothetical protein
VLHGIVVPLVHRLRGDRTIHFELLPAGPIILASEPFIAHAVDDCEATRMVGNGEVAQPPCPRRLGNVANGVGAIAAKGMHLEIAADGATGIRGQDPIALGARQEAAPHRGRLGTLRRIGHPATQHAR